MKISLASDLHFEMYDKKTPFWKPNHTDMDVMILAGDIHNGFGALPWIQEHFDKVPYVLYVMGNHEYYGGKRRVSDFHLKLKAVAEEMNLHNLHILQNNFIDIDGVRFLGGTLWTDFSLGGNKPLAMFDAKQIMNDYKRIRYDKGGKLRPEHTVIEHAATKSFIFNNLTDNKNVVITHHHPCFYQTEAKRTPVPADAAYYSTMQNDIAYCEKPINYWFCGHTHCDVDYEIYNTRLVTNQAGYIFDRTTPFSLKDFEL